MKHLSMNTHVWWRGTAIALTIAAVWQIYYAVTVCAPNVPVDIQAACGRLAGGALAHWPLMAAGLQALAVAALAIQAWRHWRWLRLGLYFYLAYSCITISLPAILFGMILLWPIRKATAEFDQPAA